MARRNRAPSETEGEVSEYDDEGRSGDERVESRGSSGAGLRWLEVFLLFIAFGLMAIAASTPITEKFYLFSVKVSVNAIIDKVSDEFRFGVWGYCTTGVKNSLGIGKLKINSSVSKGGCQPRKLGWTFKNIPGMDDNTQEAISGALTTAFVLHVVAAVMIFIALCVAAVGAAKRDPPVYDSDNNEKRSYDSEKDEEDVADKRQGLRKKVFISVLMSFIFTMIVFILDVAGVIGTKNTVHDKSKGNAELGFGLALWFVVATFGLVLIAFFISLVDLKKSKRLRTERRSDRRSEYD